MLISMAKGGRCPRASPPIRIARAVSLSRSICIRVILPTRPCPAPWARELVAPIDAFHDQARRLLAGGHMAELGRIAERHPGLKLLIDHHGRGGGGGSGTDDAAFANLGEMLALAKYPNVAVKLSGATSYSSEPYPYRNIHKYIRQIVDAFGPQRCFWGTDITRMPCSYRQCVTMFTEELPWLQGRDKDLVMGQAIIDWLGWKRPA